MEPCLQRTQGPVRGRPDGISNDDSTKFEAFLSDYRIHGNGSLGISVPGGAASRAAITYFGERAASTGIGRDKILVSTRDTSSVPRVVISYISYTAHAELAATGRKIWLSAPTI